VSLVQRAGTGEQYPLSFDALTAGSASSGLLDEATLSFAKIQWEYKPIAPDGSVGAPVRGGWDVSTNRRL